MLLCYGLNVSNTGISNRGSRSKAVRIMRSCNAGLFGSPSG